MTTMLLKTKVVLKRLGATQRFASEQDPGSRLVLTLPEQTSKDMGHPETITVTIVPGE